MPYFFPFCNHALLFQTVICQRSKLWMIFVIIQILILNYLPRTNFLTSPMLPSIKKKAKHKKSHTSSHCLMTPKRSTWLLMQHLRKCMMQGSSSLEDEEQLHFYLVLSTQWTHSPSKTTCPYQLEPSAKGKSIQEKCKLGRKRTNKKFFWVTSKQRASSASIPPVIVTMKMTRTADKCGILLDRTNSRNKSIAVPHKNATTPNRSHMPRPNNITKMKQIRSEENTGTAKRRKVSQLQDPIQLQHPSKCKVDTGKAQSAHEAHLNNTIQVIKQGLLERNNRCKRVTIVVSTFMIQCLSFTVVTAVCAGRTCPKQTSSCTFCTNLFGLNFL